MGRVALVSLDKDCAELLGSGSHRNHLVVWYRTQLGRDKVVGAFIGAGSERGDMIAVALPLREFEDFETSIAREVQSFDLMLESQSLILHASPEFLPSADRSHLGRARDVFGELEKRAKADGRGLRLVGRVPSLLFERGDVDDAVEMERLAGASLDHGQLMCLYDLNRTDKAARRHVREINSVHTHILSESVEGRVTLRKRAGARAI